MCAQLSWDVENAVGVYLFAESQDWQDHPVAVQGREERCLKEATTFVLRAVSADGVVETREIRIPARLCPGSDFVPERPNLLCNSPI